MFKHIFKQIVCQNLRVVQNSREGGREGGEGGEEAEARENIQGGAKVKTSELCF